MAMQKAKGILRETCREFEGFFVRDYHGLVEAYKTEDAEIVVTGMGSVVGVLWDMVDEYREKGHKIGLLKVSCFMPFPKGG